MDTRELKLRPLALAKILYERTDEDHYLTTPQLLKILDEEYHLPTHRTTIPTDIAVLQEFGMEIQVTKSSQMRYNLISRDFDYAELKLLIDAVASSKFISKEKSESLAGRIAAIGGVHRAEELKRNISVERRIKTDNERTLHIIDKINEAINLGKMIRFQYFEYNVKKERKPRLDGYFYRISPYRLVWNGDYYYVVGLKDKKDTISSYRVDRMVAAPEIMDQDAKPLPVGFDLDAHLNTMMRMYSSERTKVTLICNNSVMDAIIDRFGEDVATYAYDMENFKAEVEVAVNKIFFMWIFGFGGLVKIKDPIEVKEQYRQMIEQASKDI